MTTIPPDPTDPIPTEPLFTEQPTPPPPSPAEPAAPTPSTPDPTPAATPSDQPDERLMAQLLALVNSIPPEPADLPAIRPITAAVLIELRLAHCPIADAIEYGTNPDSWTSPADQAILAYLLAGPIPAIRKTFLNLRRQDDPATHALNSALTWLSSQPVGIIDPIILAAIAQTRRIRLSQVTALEPSTSKNAPSPSRS